MERQIHQDVGGSARIAYAMMLYESCPQITNNSKFEYYGDIMSRERHTKLLWNYHLPKAVSELKVAPAEDAGYFPQV